MKIILFMIFHFLFELFIFSFIIPKFFGKAYEKWQRRKDRQYTDVSIQLGGFLR